MPRELSRSQSICSRSTLRWDGGKGGIGVLAERLLVPLTLLAIDFAMHCGSSYLTRCRSVTIENSAIRSEPTAILMQPSHGTRISVA
jgi:hypothetical protein